MNVTFAIVKQAEPPLTLVECIQETSSGALTFKPICKGRYGSAIDVTLILTELLHWNAKFVWTNTWGMKVNGTWVGAVGDVASGNVDTSVPQLNPSYERSKLVNFIGSSLQSQQDCFTHCYNEETLPSIVLDVTRLFPNPFNLCLLVLLSILLCVTNICVITYVTHNGSFFIGLKRGILVIYQSVVNIDVSGVPHSLTFSEKHVYMALRISVFFLTNVVISKLTMIFMIQHAIPFNTIPELIEKVENGQMTIVPLNPGMYNLSVQLY